ncbi:MAG: 4-(cytidine 5'-diphospho)-2-C-methyl-D-erythritol kinase [Candidatus Omnitrophica bacterium]|nr:4-(cytidine 5'-diphospho)-2-C-methyl-D-erythritol kinase [Candidatus Omnitrophota bacterium]
MNSLTVNVPAKINLYLRLTGKRKDGYNSLCTIFQKINLYDRLTLKKAKGFRLIIDGITPCSVKENTIYKAYRLLKSSTRFKGALHVHLTKRIPAGSGLGGASADAAYTLLGMNRLFKLGLNQFQLLELGKKIGADVPFFLHKYPVALGVERGDLLINLPVRRKYWILLVIYEKKLSTKKVYKAFNYLAGFRMSLTKLSREVTILSLNFKQGKLVSLGKALKNDLTSVACSLMPEVKDILRSIKECGASACAMTGSGPTVFALFKNKREVQAARERLLEHRGFKTIVCQTLH